MGKLPNLYVSRDVYGGPIASERSRFTDEVLYVPAERIADLEKWVADLQSGLTVNCVYCGHCYGPNESTPVSMAEVLKEHIAGCPQHPLASLRDRIRSLVEKWRAERYGGNCCRVHGASIIAEFEELLGAKET